MSILAAIADFFRSGRSRLLLIFILLTPILFWARPRYDRQWALDISLIGTTITGNEEGTRHLLTRGADVNGRAEDSGETVLMLAARGDRSVKQPGQLVADHAAVLKLLLENGASINARDNAGRTALMYAAEHGRDELVQVLLEAGADATAQDRAGRTAWQWAEQNGHETTSARLRAAEGKK